MYTVTFDDEAIKFLEKLEKAIAKRIFNKIMATKENPQRYFERLTERKDYKLRVGNYRAVADIDDSEKSIHITLIGHRKNVYKK